MSRGGPDIKAIFNAALEHSAGPRREAYLAEACGNDAGLRRRVEELLAAYAQASDILGPSGAPATTMADGASTEANEASGASDPTDVGRTTDRALSSDDLEATTSLVDHGAAADGDGLAPGASVRYFGDYEVRRELGRGGMGVVYEARQVSLNRPVALKMVKAGLLAGDDELRRFQNEAEAVALLDHPGIVPVYEVGQHDGQRYFSMKLVPGGSLVPLLDRYRDDTKATANLVAEAAEAVAHAHARGILHRDLKPANILVDPEGHPHVTDFGLAKKVEADIEFTRSGAILGTPAYMSPEQATGRRGSITTATDVYGLGALLYALLTGHPPFGGDSVVETIDAVRNVPPARPTMLNARVPRDLETICLKCLEKDPRRRYATAQALADDLKAWLGSRPIAARRVGAAERAWLWCKRKPAVATLSAAVVLAVVVGTASIIAVQAKANANLRAANTRVEQQYNLAVDAIKTFHTGVSEDFLLKEDKFKDLRERLLKSAESFYEKLGALLKDEADLPSRRALLQANYELAVLADLVGRKEDALAMHRKVLAGREGLARTGSRVDVARSLLSVAELLHATGKETEALTYYERARAAVSAPDGGTPADPAARAALAASEYARGMLLQLQGKTAESLAALEHARDQRDDLAAADPGNKDLQRERARTYGEIGFTRVIMEQADPEAASTAYKAALAIRQKVYDDDPAAMNSRRDLARSHANLGELLLWTGKGLEAEAVCRTALAIFQKLVEDNPAVTRFRADLGHSHNTLGQALWRMGKGPEAETEHRRALALFQKPTE
jgi:tetratricopeptide (TPR) repeat protein/predicted Ser/Thr protein kinase